MNSVIFDGLSMQDRRDFVREVQLSQRGRAMFYVIEYFAKSLGVIRNDILE